MTELLVLLEFKEILDRLAQRVLLVDKVLQELQVQQV
jgi:hypothetical protein